MSGSTGRRSDDADLGLKAECLVAIETNLDPTSLALLKRALESTIMLASSNQTTEVESDREDHGHTDVPGAPISKRALRPTAAFALQAQEREVEMGDRPDIDPASVLGARP